MKTGFSLVELSIVLVILGLLTGGILTGQSLIRAAELRAVTTEFNVFQTAVRTFQDKYFAIPGDMANATDFWGAAHATPATCLTTAGTGTQTCNGDGNGLAGIVFASQYAEPYTFWQHLTNAGLLEGAHTGIAPPPPGTSTPEQTPSSKLSNAAWVVDDLLIASAPAGDGNIVPGDPDFFEGAYGRWPLTLRTRDGNQVVRPEEAWNIDQKIDDGIPGIGLVRVQAQLSGCTNAISIANSLAAEYTLTNTSIECDIMFTFLK